MKKFWLIFLLTLQPSLWAQEITPREIVTMVLENSPEVVIINKNLELAENRYNLALAATKPTLSASGGYKGYQSLGTNELYGNAENYTQNSFPLSLTLAQTIATGGSYSVTLENETTLTTYEGVSSPLYSQSPSLAASLTQPVIINNRFIDTTIRRKKVREAELARLKEELNIKITRNTLLQDTLEQYFNILDLENQIDVQKRWLEADKEDVANQEKSFTLKLISETELWETQLDLEERRENLLSLEQELDSKKENLAFLSGRESLPVLKHFTPVLEITEIPLEPASLDANHSLKIKEHTLEEAELKEGLADLLPANAPLTMNTSFSISPTYADSRTPTSSLAESFTDFAADNSTLDWRLSITLEMKILDGGIKELNKANDARNKEIAAQQLKMEEQLLLEGLKRELKALQNLKDKTAFLQDQLKLKKRKVEIEEKLLLLKQGTELEVKKARLDLEEQENKIWKNKVDIYLQQLTLLRMMGKDLMAYL